MGQKMETESKEGKESGEELKGMGRGERGRGRGRGERGAGEWERGNDPLLLFRAG